MVIGSPPFISAIHLGHLEGVVNNPILRGRTRSMVINHVSVTSWDDPPSWDATDDSRTHEKSWVPRQITDHAFRWVKRWFVFFSTVQFLSWAKDHHGY